MKWFKKHARYNVASLAEQLDAQPELWDERPQRLMKGGPFEGTSDIWVRWRAEHELTSPQAYLEPHFAVWYPAWRKLPALQPIVYDLMARTKAVHLGGILLTRIPAGGEIKAHHDRGGWHAEFYNTKVYVVIRNNDKCVNFCGGEQVIMSVGDAWQFDNQVLHGLYNQGPTERVSAIICMRCEP